MGIIYTICPMTGLAVSTGIETDADTFAVMPETVSRVRCPHCGELHNWSKHNAYLRD
jgi:hypothetical protein